jgi:ABC-type multidrug transport system ATPase subunit
MLLGRMNGPVISVRGLHKSYADQEAVRGIDFDISAGEIFGFLGPNGAGKSTTIEILEGYRPRTAGDVSPDSASTIAPFGKKWPSSTSALGSLVGGHEHAGDERSRTGPGE